MKKMLFVSLALLTLLSACNSLPKAGEDSWSSSLNDIKPQNNGEQPDLN